MITTQQLIISFNSIRYEFSDYESSQMLENFCCRQIDTVGSKIIRALAIVLEVFHWFHGPFLSSHACYKQYKA